MEYLLGWARKRFPGDRDLTNQATRTCEAGGEWELAASLYRHLVKQNPDHPLAYERLERMLIKKGERDQALNLWKPVASGSHLRMRALKRAAAILKEDGDFASARGFLT